MSSGHDNPSMPVRRHPIDVGWDRARLLLASTCRQIDEARVDRGLSYASLGRAVGLSGQQVARICRGRVPTAPLTMLARLATLVGLELAARTFPGGQPLRDGGQQALLARFRARLGPAIGWQVEVPVVNDPLGNRPDLRAWDAVLVGADWRAGIEAETNVRDAQALIRRLALKQRDGKMHGGVVLVLNDSRHHRGLMRAEVFRDAFPGSARAALASLQRGEAPGNAVVLL
jgi:transcriptional regulator with XRE-family HTH domain